MRVLACWKALIPLGMLRISGNRSYREFGYALGIGVAPDEMRLSKSPMHEGISVGAEAMSRGSSLFLSLSC